MGLKLIGENVTRESTPEEYSDWKQKTQTPSTIKLTSPKKTKSSSSSTKTKPALTLGESKTYETSQSKPDLYEVIKPPTTVLTPSIPEVTQSKPEVIVLKAPTIEQQIERRREEIKDKEDVASKNVEQFYLGGSSSLVAGATIVKDVITKPKEIAFATQEWAKTPVPTHKEAQIRNIESGKRLLKVAYEEPAYLIGYGVTELATGYVGGKAISKGYELIKPVKYSEVVVKTPVESKIASVLSKADEGYIQEVGTGIATRKVPVSMKDSVIKYQKQTRQVAEIGQTFEGKTEKYLVSGQVQKGKLTEASLAKAIKNTEDELTNTLVLKPTKAKEVYEVTPFQTNQKGLSAQIGKTTKMELTEGMIRDIPRTPMRFKKSIPDVAYESKVKTLTVPIDETRALSFKKGTTSPVLLFEREAEKVAKRKPFDLKKLFKKSVKESVEDIPRTPYEQPKVFRDIDKGEEVFRRPSYIDGGDIGKELESVFAGGGQSKIKTSFKDLEINYPDEAFGFSSKVTIPTRTSVSIPKSLTTGISGIKGYTQSTNKYSPEINILKDENLFGDLSISKTSDITKTIDSTNSRSKSNQRYFEKQIESQIQKQEESFKFQEPSYMESPTITDTDKGFKFPPIIPFNFESNFETFKMPSSKRRKKLKRKSRYTATLGEALFPSAPIKLTMKQIKSLQTAEFTGLERRPLIQITSEKEMMKSIKNLYK